MIEPGRDTSTTTGTEDELLAVSILGIKFSNPILVGSGSFSDSLPQIRRLLASGAGGVVTKTIYVGEKPSVTERVMKSQNGLFNSTTYSRASLTDWLRTLATLGKEGAPVITSIYAKSPKDLGTLARLVVNAGARALELGLSCPNDLNDPATSRPIAEYIAEVHNAVSVPFSVKLSAVGSVVEQVKEAVREGADAISISDALPSLLVNSENRTLVFGGPAAYSGPPIKPIVLNSIYELRQSGIACPIFGIGGIGNVTDVLEYLQIGASAIQLYTILITEGVGVISLIAAELLAWCKKEGITASQLVGAALVNGVQ